MFVNIALPRLAGTAWEESPYAVLHRTSHP